MRRVSYYIILTADGMYADPDGGLGHYDPAEDEHRYANDLIREPTDEFTGRRMYEVMDYWDELDIDAPEVAEDERMAGLRLVIGTDRQPQVPRRVLVPAVPLEKAVLVLGARLRLAPVAVQDVLPLGDEGARVLHGGRVEFVPGHRRSVHQRPLRRRGRGRDGRRTAVLRSPG